MTKRSETAYEGEAERCRKNGDMEKVREVNRTLEQFFKEGTEREWLWASIL